MKITSLLLMIVLFGAFSLYAQPTDTTPTSLKGLKNSKVIFDVNVGKPKLLLIRLNLIEKTLEEISKHTKYKAVIAIRGKASDFMTKNNRHIDKKFIPIKKKIYQQLKDLKNRYNVRLEQCAIALKFRKISPKEVYGFIKVVKNGYISLIGYQNKGYAFVPMD